MSYLFFCLTLALFHFTIHALGIFRHLLISLSPMATNTFTGTSLSAFNSIAGPRSISISSYGRRNVSFSPQQRSIRLTVSCAAKQAKPQTVEKVCKIVKNQLALPDDSNVTGESTLASLGADSLDTVEIVLGLEEEFGITVEEDSALTISTVQEAADLIEEIINRQTA